MLFYLFLFVVLGATLYYIQSPYRKLPGPFGHVFLPLSFISKYTPDTLHLYFLDMSKHYAPLYHVNFFSEQFVFVCDKELVSHVLKEREMFQMPPYMRSSLLDGNPLRNITMFTSEGELWHRKNSILRPLLRMKMLKSNTDIIIQNTYKLTRAIKRGIKETGGDLEILRYLYCITCDVISEVTFGESFNTLEDGMGPFDGVAPMELVPFLITSMGKKITVPSKKLWRFVVDTTKEAEFYQMFDRYVLDLISRKQSSGSYRDEYSLISMLLQFREEESDIAEEIYPICDIVGECFSFFGAGQDTTARTLGIILHYLGRHPRVQEKLYEEIRTVDESLKGEISQNDLSQMNYLNSVIKETQRIQSIINVLVREVMTDDVELKGYRIPKGSWIVMDLHSLHVSEVYFENPTEFYPERWIESKLAGTPQYAFGEGKRSCFGKHLAMLEMRAVLYSLIKEFTIVSDGEMVMSSQIGLEPVGGVVNLHFEERK
eukprot:TRINITY_DN10962_c0_g1_i1.p1 TRINITY_DN10962_c0_g1~~TRINITY_DN10962_c0_g1_i1.p1  ORF type:complete len:487 (-),score=87.66 TRINITY_DN10962_c0_g1_i1:32-1492(-)